MLLGAALVFFLFPKQEDELAMLERYAAEDSERAEQGITPSG